MNQTNRTTSRASDAVRDMVSGTSESLTAGARQCTDHYLTEPASDLFSLARDYAKDKPEVAAAWAFAVGVIVGWRIKPW